MDVVFIVLRLVLASVFALAGVMKLRDLERTQADFAALGLPAWIIPTVSFRLPIVELAVAGMLLIEPLAGVGAVCALGLLGLFTAAITANLVRGRRPTCACFGALTQSAISWKSVARNALLMGLAVVIIGLPNVAVTLPLIDSLSSLMLITLAMAVSSATWLLLLTRQNGRLLLRVEQLERGMASQAAPQPAPTQPLRAGDALPPLPLNDARGRPFDLRSLRGAPALLLFLDAGCSHCQTMLAQLRDAQPTTTALVVISESAALRQALPAAVTVLVDPGWTTREVFGVRGTPAAVSLEADGALARPVAHGASAVRAMLDQVTAREDAIEEMRHELAPV
jgi:uncharacterized membrane protein YphA (DoxX/SURF4 family)